MPKIDNLLPLFLADEPLINKEKPGQFTILNLRWLDRFFQGQYLPSLSINYIPLTKIWKNCHHRCIR